MTVIVGEKCLTCQHHAAINPDDPRNTKIKCVARDKEYIWGQRVPCEEYKKYESKNN